MSDKHAKPVEIRFGKNYPSPTTLRTGDMLFSRTPDPAAAVLAPPLMEVMRLESTASRMDPADLNKPLDEFLGPHLTWLLARRAGLTDEAPPVELESTIGQMLSDAFLDDFEEIVFLLFIISIDMGDLMKKWFKLTVAEFLLTPFVDLLKKSLEGEIQNSFFIGHCAMVLREKDGRSSDDPDAPLYIIEANSSSFANYGVNITRYHFDPHAPDGRGLPRSWAAHRAERGEHVWHARHLLLQEGPSQVVGAVREAILASAKSYLGRGYSFFDNPTFADAGRLYCSEFIYRVFQDAQKGFGTHPSQPALSSLDTGKIRTWKWMRETNPPGNNPGDLGHAIEEVWDHWLMRHKIRTMDFFIFTVQMLWRSPALQAVFRPGGDEYQ